MQASQRIFLLAKQEIQPDVLEKHNYLMSVGQLVQSVLFRIIKH